MNKKKIMTMIMDKIKGMGGELIPITGHRPVFVGAIDRINCGTYHGSRDCVNCGACLLSDEEYVQAYGHLRTPMIREHQAISPLDVHEIIKRINKNLNQMEKIEFATINIDRGMIPEFDEFGKMAGQDYDPVLPGWLEREQSNWNLKRDAEDFRDMATEDPGPLADMDKTEAELCCEGCPQHNWCKNHGLVGTCYNDLE